MKPFKIDFHYKKTLVPLLILMIIGGMGTSLAFVGTKSLLLIKPEDAADTIVFLSLGIVFILLGIPFLIYAILYFKRNKRFYDNQPWTGIEIEGRQLRLVYFNNWKLKQQTINVDLIEKIVQDSTKGQRFIRCVLKNRKPPFIIPTQRLTLEETQQLVAQLSYAITHAPLSFAEQYQAPTPVIISKSESTLSAFHLQQVEALMRIIEARYGFQFRRTQFTIDEKTYLFGADSTESHTPFIELKKVGEGMGDYYSGAYEYHDVFSVRQLPASKEGERIIINYNRQATNIAGDCSIFMTNLSDDDANKLEDQFYLELAITEKEKCHFLQMN